VRCDGMNKHFVALAFGLAFAAGVGSSFVIGLVSVLVSKKGEYPNHFKMCLRSSRRADFSTVFFPIGGDMRRQ
jgi:hypothetical protein